MPLLLPSIISNASRPHHAFVLLESSAAGSCLPVFRSAVNHDVSNASVILCSFLYLPSSVIGDIATSQNTRLQVLDRTDTIPGYSEAWDDPLIELKEKIESAPAGPLTVAIDSIDTLCSDLGSASKCYVFISTLLALIRVRASSSRLIVHVNSPSPILPLLLPTRLSPSLAHMIAHPPVLIKHIAETHLTVPPPGMPPERFWRVFSPIASRAWEVERLVYGDNGPGPGSYWEEAVLEMIVRGPGAGPDGKRRGTERTLEGWTQAKGPCELTELESLRKIWRKLPADETPIDPDPTKNLPFNLSLTPGQQHLRASVPVPYAHDGNTAPLSTAAPSANSGAIYYDPDSGDDIDDDDPDEDLDI